MASQSWPLRGRTILLVGGPPSVADDRPKHEPTNGPGDEIDVRVEESVLALARGVFARGGQILTREDPSLTPLVLEAALEYWEALPGEESRGDLERRRFVDAPVAVFRESREPRGATSEKDVSGDLGRAARIGCLRYVNREQLDELPIAFVVCIGGSGDMRQELAPYARVRRDRVPVNVIPSTGGAASRAVSMSLDDLVVIDAEKSVMDEIRRQRLHLQFDPPKEFRRRDEERARGGQRFDAPTLDQEAIPDFAFAFYPLLIAILLDERR